MYINNYHCKIDIGPSATRPSCEQELDSFAQWNRKQAAELELACKIIIDPKIEFSQKDIIRLLLVLHPLSCYYRGGYHLLSTELLK